MYPERMLWPAWWCQPSSVLGAAIGWRAALEAGYHVTFLKDAVADFTEEAHRAALEISYPTFGHETLTIEEFLNAVQGRQART